MKKAMLSIFVGAVIAPACGQWVDLPATEEQLKTAIATAQREGDCEEVMISDYAGFRAVSEYENIFDLNDEIEELDGLTDDEREVYEALVGEGYTHTEALEIVSNGDYIYYDDCMDMTDVAYRYVEETGLLQDVPDLMQRYFDYEAFGRDMSYEGRFISTDDGYIEVTR